MASTAALILGGLAAAGGVTSAVIGANAAGNAAESQAQSAGNALDFQKAVYAQQQANEAPWLAAGQGSIAQIMSAIANGTYGPGSLPAPPSFTAPSLEQAQQTPGYEFTREQGNRGILEGAAAAGGTISGGTLRQLDQYNTNLANTTYGDVFNRALTGYNAALQNYQAGLSKQSQEFNQLASVAGLGQTAAQGINATGTAAAANAGSLLQAIGNANAAGTVGTANAITGGIGSSINGISQALLLSKLLGGGGAGGGLNLPLDNLGVNAPGVFGLDSLLSNPPG